MLIQPPASPPERGRRWRNSKSRPKSPKPDYERRVRFKQDAVRSASVDPRHAADHVITNAKDARFVHRNDRPRSWNRIDSTTCRVAEGYIIEAESKSTAATADSSSILSDALVRVRELSRSVDLLPQSLAERTVESGSQEDADSSSLTSTTVFRLSPRSKTSRGDRMLRAIALSAPPVVKTAFALPSGMQS